MSTSRPTITRSGTDPARELDPDQLDQLLADLEARLDDMPADNPAAQELRQEIETFRAMVESLHANAGWQDDKYHSQRETVHEIAERLKGRIG